MTMLEKIFTTLPPAPMPTRFENDTTRHFLENGGPWDWSDPTYVEFLRLWMLAQMDAYEYTEKGAGWFFWSAKQQGETNIREWSYLSLLQLGVAPADLCSRETFCILQEDVDGNLLSTSYNASMAKASFKNI